jgi:SAM-dependent methyltransferase
MAEYSYKIIDGIKCYNPDSAITNDCYPPEAFENLFRLEQNNFWFKARNRLILYLFKKYIPKDKKLNTLEIGCGTGFVLRGLKKFSNLKLSGAEIFLQGLSFAAKRLPDVEFFQLDAANMQFVSEYDIICTFDVLEHIEEDEITINNIHKALKDEGLFFISVPQHRFIWGAIDELSNHKRRYTRNELTGKLKQAGFSVLYTSSFVFSLFPFMVVSRLLNRKALPKNKENGQDLYHELNMNSVLNRVFYLYMLFDELLIKMGIRLPYGGSLIMVAKKAKK